MKSLRKQWGIPEDRVDSWGALLLCHLIPSLTRPSETSLKSTQSHHCLGCEQPYMPRLLWAWGCVWVG